MTDLNPMSPENKGQPPTGPGTTPNGSNFSVGYLIGGGGGGGGNGGIGGPPHPNGELHSLASSECLSLVPIVTTAFDEGSNSAGSLQPFWGTGFTGFDQPQHDGSV